VRHDDGYVYVALTPFCEKLGTSAQMQRSRIMRHDTMAEGLINLITPEIGSRNSRGSGGGPQNAFFLRLDFVSAWLMTIRTKAVKAEVRDVLRRFQLEAFRAVHEHFFANAQARSLIQELFSLAEKKWIVHCARQIGWPIVNMTANAIENKERRRGTPEEGESIIPEWHGPLVGPYWNGIDVSAVDAALKQLLPAMSRRPSLLT
jgi:hypothetical protein